MTYARVVIDSPLPQLDRLFDYQIPEQLAEQIQVGVRVIVPFGRAATKHNGFVIELTETASFDGQVAFISEVISPLPVLRPEIYQLARAVADRQASSVSDVLRLAIPARSVAVEKRAIESAADIKLLERPERATRQTALQQPAQIGDKPIWVINFLERISDQLNAGRSAVVIVPDFRDQAVLLDALKGSAMADRTIDYSSDQTPSKRYAAFLSCMRTSAAVVVGSRSAIFAPVNNLAELLIWDENDPSLVEPASPYFHTRDVALIRQQQSGCNIFFAAHSRSTEMQRLVEIGYLEDVTSNFPVPKLAVSPTEPRVDSMAWQVVRQALEVGPVLVQVANKGQSVSAYCAECAERAKCNSCAGPIWLGSDKHPRCRWCNATNLNFVCQVCGSRQLKQGRAGSTRTAAEFGKAFAQAVIVEANAEHRLQWVKRGKTIVVATPGAEPRVAGGYEAVVILDAKESLAKDSLRATEDAIRGWSNAVAMLAPGGQAVITGLSQHLGQQLALWSQVELAKHELQTRRELRFVPAVRMASVEAERSLLDQVIDSLSSFPEAEILGPISSNHQSSFQGQRILIRYDYSVGAKLADFLKALSLQLSAGQSRINAKSGRAMRPIRIKMDDSQVI